MLVDPFTVGAQILNFLILVVVLKFLLYDRVIEAMDGRQRRISEHFARAEKRERNADREARRHERVRTRLLRERDERLHHAEQEAERRRDELVEQARRDVAELERRWRTAVEDERDRLLTELREGAADRVLQVTRRVLEDLADETLEDRIIDVFVGRLEDAQIPIPDTSGGLEVRTAFPLDDTRRHRVATAVRKHVADHPVRFARDPGLLGGIELFTDGHALGWNLAAYLDELEVTLQGLLREEGQER